MITETSCRDAAQQSRWLTLAALAVWFCVFGAMNADAASTATDPFTTPLKSFVDLVTGPVAVSIAMAVVTFFLGVDTDIETLTSTWSG